MRVNNWCYDSLYVYLGDAEQPIAVWRKADEIDGSAANSKHYQFTLSNVNIDDSHLSE